MSKGQHVSSSMHCVKGFNVIEHEMKSYIWPDFYNAISTTEMAKKRGYSVVAASTTACSSHGMAALVLGLACASILAGASSNFAAGKDHLFPEFIKWHVYVVNGLSNNQSLFTRCKSKDNDLGIQNISPASNFTWSFRTEFFHSTLFWCHVRKDNASAAFEAFWYDARLFNMCNWKNCIWVAKDNGIYLTDLAENREELLYRWDA